MSKVARSLLTIAVGIGALTSTTYASDNFIGSGGTVFVMTNDASKNEVLAYQRLFDGRLTLKERFNTGGRGSGGTTDPLQSQGSLILSEDHNLLFAINSGSGTISSFHLLDGLPILVDQEPTGGSEPVAVAKQMAPSTSSTPVEMGLSWPFVPTGSEDCARSPTPRPTLRQHTQAAPRLQSAPIAEPLPSSRRLLTT
jgi:hypothetical protein